MSRMDFLDEGQPAPKSGPERFVRRVRGGESKMFVILSSEVWSVWVHWNGRRSEPHFTKKDLCNGCKRGEPKRWKGYLDVQNVNDKQREFLEITPGIDEQIRALVPAGDDWRGQRVTITRGKGDKARCHVQLHTSAYQAWPGVKLPEPIDPRPSLLALWGCVDLNDTGLSQEDSPPQSEVG